MKVNTFEDYKQKVHLNNLGFLLLMPIIIDFASVAVREFGMISSSSVTMVIYGFSLIFITLKVLKIVSAREMANDIILYILILFPFIFNYICFDKTRSYLISQEMLIIFFFFAFVSVMSIRKIYRWDCSFEELIKPGGIAVTLAVIILLFFDYEQNLVYMGFSYALLPFICNFYRQGRLDSSKRKRVIYILFFIVGLLTILAFGARATIGFSFIYIVAFEISRSDLKLQNKIISFLALIGIVLLIGLNAEAITNMLLKFDLFKNSYFLQNLLKGNLLESSTREILYESCKNRMQIVGITVSGFFGDRAYCVGFPYPHNIFYELIMSFGWLLGSALIVFYSLVLLKGLITRGSTKREIVIFIMITILARYIISGSYLIENRFWIATFLIFSLSFGKSMGMSDAVSI